MLDKDRLYELTLNEDSFNCWIKLIKNSILFKCKNYQLKTIICKTDKNVSFCQEIAKILVLLSIPYFFGEMHPSCLCS